VNRFVVIPELLDLAGLTQECLRAVWIGQEVRHNLGVCPDERLHGLVPNDLCHETVSFRCRLTLSCEFLGLARVVGLTKVTALHLADVVEGVGLAVYLDRDWRLGLVFGLVLLVLILL
jgi:hypothetical protein